MQKALRILFLPILLLLSASFPAWTQISPGLPILLNPVPDMSPNAESAQNVNVDLYHGVAHVSIPLYQVRNRNANVSISLNYTPPNKEDSVIYYPGWTGLGWSLSAGGLITRTVRGVRDESVVVNGLSIWPYSFVWDQYDPHEDLFSFNFCGYSGKFFFHKGRWIVFNTTTPNIIISPRYTVGNTSPREITGFLLQFPNGFIYSFGTSVSSYVIDPNHASIEKPSAWYLSQIESPEGDCLYFNYEKESNCAPRPVYNCTQYYAIYSGSNSEEYNKLIPDSLTWTPPTGYVTYRLNPSDYASITPVYLRSITGGRVSVFFNRSVATEKAPSFSDPPLSVDVHSYQLNSIELIEEETQKCIKKYLLNYTSDTEQTLKLLSVTEQGVKVDNSTVNKPPYELNYISQNTTSVGATVTLLQKMTYPSGGFTTFEYEYCNLSNANYQMKMPRLYSVYNRLYFFRIKNIRSYGDENETPSVTEYSYGNSILSRPRRVYSGFQVMMPYNQNLNGYKTSNYDQYIPKGYYVTKLNHYAYYTLITDPDEVGYGYVGVAKHKGSQSESAGYFYAVHYPNNPYLATADRAKSYKHGTLIRIERSNGPKHTTIDFDYMDPERIVDTIQHKWIEYFPFKISGDEYTYLKRDSGQFHYNYHSPIPTQITEHAYYGGWHDSIRISAVKYDQVTGNVLYKETRDRAGNVYRTEYRYYDHSLLNPYNVRDHNTPFETIVKKNGRVISATVVQDTVVHQTQCIGGCPDIIRPKKVFVLASNTPIDDYQPANVSSHDRQPDSRCKLAATYRYDPHGNPIQMQNTGELPVLFEWDADGRLVLRIEGIENSELENARQGLSQNSTMQGQINYTNVLRKRLLNARITSYTYNVYGQTSVTDPTGYTQYTEYDVFGRSSAIKDDEGNIRQSIEYQHGINP
jgi:hypothetical protein